MVKRVNGYSCYECIHLQREDPIISGQMALYHCTSQKRGGRCVGWVEAERPDKGLKTQGGSCCNKIYPGDVILCHARFKEVTAKWLYCGTVGNRKRLVYNKNKMEYKAVPSDWFRTQFGNLNKNISIMEQNPEQLEASKRMAKKRKRKYEQSCNWD